MPPFLLLFLDSGRGTTRKGHSEHFHLMRSSPSICRELSSLVRVYFGFSRLSLLPRRRFPGRDRSKVFPLLPLLFVSRYGLLLAHHSVCSMHTRSETRRCLSTMRHSRAGASESATIPSRLNQIYEPQKLAKTIDQLDAKPFTQRALARQTFARVGTAERVIRFAKDEQAASLNGRRDAV